MAVSGKYSRTRLKLNNVNVNVLVRHYAPQHPPRPIPAAEIARLQVRALNIDMSTLTFISNGMGIRTRRDEGVEPSLDSNLRRVALRCKPPNRDRYTGRHGDPFSGREGVQYMWHRSP